MRPISRTAVVTGCYAAPHHQASTTKFDRALNIVLCERAAIPHPPRLASTRSYKVKISFIRKDDAPPFLCGPVSVFLAKGKALVDMPRQKSRLFLDLAFSPS